MNVSPSNKFKNNLLQRYLHDENECRYKLLQKSTEGTKMHVKKIEDKDGKTHSLFVPVARVNPWTTLRQDQNSFQSKNKNPQSASKTSAIQTNISTVDISNAEDINLHKRPLKTYTRVPKSKQLQNFIPTSYRHPSESINASSAPLLKSQNAILNTPLNKTVLFTEPVHYNPTVSSLNFSLPPFQSNFTLPFLLPTHTLQLYNPRPHFVNLVNSFPCPTTAVTPLTPSCAPMSFAPSPPVLRGQLGFNFAPSHRKPSSFPVGIHDIRPIGGSSLHSSGKFYSIPILHSGAGII